MAGPPNGLVSRRATKLCTRFLEMHRDQRCYRLQEISDQIEKGIEAIVVHPVSGIFDRHYFRVAKVARPAVVHWVGSPAFLAKDQKRRAADPPPQLFDLDDSLFIGRIGSDVIVEFPAVGAVLVLIDAILGKVPRLL